MLAAFNEATESMVERTLYDKLFFQNELQRAIMRQTNKKKEASPKELREMYQQVSHVAGLVLSDR